MKKNIIYILILIIVILFILVIPNYAADSAKVPVDGCFKWYDTITTPDSAFISIKDTASSLVTRSEVNWNTHFWDTVFTVLPSSDWVYINILWFKDGDSITKTMQFDIMKQIFIYNN